ncbi:DsbA family protein [Nitratifractor salsuginis]|uniref:DSBA oxidoreductase n=1 Tax=Nitratifractor salsuginis (strain DSM 16511 / JCM 12458 / E9I37-1) TaxID=749222 RepID=E6X319_NITSE|nr:DsbA family protein [Nitratifractor salsuginis]ADV46163.1 DSBA oxidoreductase [Nitratifractor salsuginis DSM 16511]
MSLITASVIASSAEFNLENFVRHTLVKNPRIKVEKVQEIAHQSLEGRPGWTVYMFTMDLVMGKRKQQIPEMVFINPKEELAAMSLIDLKTGEDLRNTIKPKMPESFYNKKHLIAGNADAPHKIVVFSDPQCPFCLGYLPGLLKDVRAHPDKMALYYYHMPLKRLHPVSETLTRAMEYLQSHGRADEAMKFYSLKIDPREKNEKKILAEIKKQLGIDLKAADIDKPEYKTAVKADMNKAASMMVRGTPTVYFDGKYDPTRSAYKKYLK